MDSNFGQIGVVPGAQAPLEWAICTVTHSEARHCLIGIGGGRAVSADLDGIHNIVISEHYPNVIWSRFDLTWEQAARIVQFALLQVGKPYALSDDFLIWMERIFHFRFPRSIRQRFAEDGQWQCSELSDMSLLAGGVDAFYPRDLVGDTAPSDFEALFIRKGWSTREEFKKYPIRWF